MKNPLVSLGFLKDVPETQTTPVMAPIQTPTPAKAVGRGSRRASADDDAEETTTTPSAPTNKEVETRLRKAIQASAGDGFDYVKFITMIKKNKNLGEDGAYAAALSAADTMGVSVDELITSAQSAIKAVNAESKKVDADLAEQAEQNATNQTELKKINSQISVLETRKEALENKINSDTSTIEDSQKSLESTIELVVSEIKEVVSKIKKNSK